MLAFLPIPLVLLLANLVHGAPVAVSDRRCVGEACSRSINCYATGLCGPALAKKSTLAHVFRPLKYARQDDDFDFGDDSDSGDDSGADDSFDSGDDSGADSSDLDFGDDSSGGDDSGADDQDSSDFDFGDDSGDDSGADDQADQDSSDLDFGDDSGDNSGADDQADQDSGSSDLDFGDDQDAGDASSADGGDLSDDSGDSSDGQDSSDDGTGVSDDGTGVDGDDGSVDGTTDDDSTSTDPDATSTAADAGITDAPGSDSTDDGDDQSGDDSTSTTSDSDAADSTSTATDSTSTDDGSSSSDSTTAATSTSTAAANPPAASPPTSSSSNSDSLTCGAPGPNAATISLIKQFEGFVPSPAPDPIGLPTVGFGHKCTSKGCAEVTNAGFSFPLSQTTASQLLNKDLGQFVSCVNSAVSNSVTLTDNQVGALTSFAFNLGCGTLKSSTLLKRLNNGEDPNTVAAAEIPRFNKAGGKVLSGLVKRRAAEVSLFQTPSQVKAHPC